MLHPYIINEHYLKGDFFFGAITSRIKQRKVMVDGDYIFSEEHGMSFFFSKQHGMPIGGKCFHYGL